MTSIASQMKDLKRRGVQKVLQQMGIADKTDDGTHSQSYQSFITLGDFLTHVKQSVQGANTAIEKMTKSQCNMASSLHTYVHSELNDDIDASGELVDFFNNQEEEGSVHAVMLQELSERFYDACNGITNNVLSDMMLSLEELVIKPINRDEEQNTQTKELTEEKKRLNLDYDAYRRTAQSASNPMENEKNEAKLRAAKDKFDACSKKVSDHLAVRNYKRSKIIIHSILTVMQQYHKFFIASAAVLGEVAGILTPLLEQYQMDERQFMDLMRMDSRPAKVPVKDGASVPPSSSSKPPRSTTPPPKAPAPTVPPKHSKSPPSSPPLPRETPSNNKQSTGPTAPPKPRVVPMFEDLMNDSNTTQNPSIPNPAPTAPAPTPAPASTHASGPSLIDPWGDIGSTPQSNSTTAPTPAPKTDANFVDISFDATPTPQPKPAPAQPSGLYNDPFDIFGAPPIQPQPVNLKPQPTVPPQPSAKPTGFGASPPPSTFYNKPPAYNPQQPPAYNAQQPPFFNAPYGAKPAAGAYAGMPNGGFNTPPPPYGQPGGFNPQPPGGGFYNASQTPGGYPPRPGFFPGNGTNPYSNPPNAGVSFVQETEGLDSTTSSKLRLWSEKNGKKQNLRALLATMHEVLWAEIDWEQKGLGELVSPAQVKKAYFRATKILHPDKVKNYTDEQKIIAKKVYECLSESYEVFKNEPL